MFFARREDAYEATVFERVEPLADESIDEAVNEFEEDIDESSALDESYDLDVDVDDGNLETHDLNEPEVAAASDTDVLDNDFDGNVTATHVVTHATTEFPDRET